MKYVLYAIHIYYFINYNIINQFLYTFNYFQIKDLDLLKCFANISKVLNDYDLYDKNKNCQQLHWRFSSSTVAKSNKNRNFQLHLDTIME